MIRKRVALRGKTLKQYSMSIISIIIVSSIINITVTITIIIIVIVVIVIVDIAQKQTSENQAENTTTEILKSMLTTCR